MKVFVLFLALFVAELNFLAFARYTELVFNIAPLTLTNEFYILRLSLIGLLSLLLKKLVVVVDKLVRRFLVLLQDLGRAGEHFLHLTKNLLSRIFILCQDILL